MLKKKYVLTNTIIPVSLTFCTPHPFAHPDFRYRARGGRKRGKMRTYPYFEYSENLTSEKKR